jgi:hypothetical protein
MILLDTAQTWLRLAEAAEVMNKTLKTIDATSHAR